MIGGSFLIQQSFDGQPRRPDRVCSECGHRHTPDGCTGDPTPSDLWAGVTPAACDCDVVTPPATTAGGRDE